MKRNSSDEMKRSVEPSTAARRVSWPLRVAACVLPLAMIGCAMLDTPQTRPRPAQPRQPQQAPVHGSTDSTKGRPAIALGTVTGRPGQDVTLVATLRTGGAQVAGTQNDVGFDAQHLSFGAGKPNCRANSGIGKTGTAFAFRPPKCQGTACTAVRALVLALDNVDPIPNGATLYTCTVRIAPSAPAGEYRIKASGVTLSTPGGQSVPNATASDGAVIVTR